jgi:hypothetical protein
MEDIRARLELKRGELSSEYKKVAIISSSVMVEILRIVMLSIGKFRLSLLAECPGGCVASSLTG